MSEQAARVLEQALLLPPEERVEVIELLQSSLEGHACDPKITQEHLREVESRIRALERGDMKTVPMDEALRIARRKRPR